MRTAPAIQVRSSIARTSGRSGTTHTHNKEGYKMTLDIRFHLIVLLFLLRVTDRSKRCPRF